MSINRQPTNLLVTGGAGFIGSAFIRNTLKDAFSGRIVNVDHLSYAGLLSNLEPVANDERHLFIHQDICNQKEIARLVDQHQIDTIVHFAAETHVDRSIADPAPFIQSNIIGTFFLLEVVRQNPHIHFHHISTDEVYGSLGDEGMFSEDSVYAPKLSLCCHQSIV